MARTKTQTKLSQIREEITEDQNFNKDFSGTPKTMLKLDHSNDAVVLGDGTDVTVEIKGTMQAAIAMGTQKITGMGQPTADQDAATKKYVDDQLTASDLDFQGDTGGALNIQLETEVLDIAGGSDINTAGSGNTLTVNLDTDLTTVSSLLKTDIKIGEDDQTKIDFETENEIHFYADNAEQVYIADGILGPETNSDVDLGTASHRFKDAYVDTVKASGNAEILGALELGNASDTTISRVSAGDIQIESNIVYRAGGTDVAVADGGTGASSHTAGQVLLGNGASAIQSRAIGISDDNIVEVDSGFVASGEYAKFTANGLESKAFSEVMTDLSGQATGSFSFGDNRIINVASPTLDTDATNKEYVDGLVQGISAKKAVRLRTSVSGGDILPEKASYKAAAASLTFNSVNLALTSNYDFAGKSIIVKTSGGSVDAGVLASSKTDGKNVVRGDRLLVMSEASDRQAAHGIYDVLHPGSDAAQNAKIEIGFGAGLPSDSDYILFRKLEAPSAENTFRIAFQSANVVSQPTAFGAVNATIPGERVVSMALSVGGSSRSANDLAADIRTLLGSINSAGDFNGWTVGGSGNVVQFEKASSQEISDDVFVEAQKAGAGPAVDIFAYAPSGGMPYLLVRSEDSDGVGDDKDGEFELGAGSFVFVQEGSTFADTGFVCSSDNTLVANQTLDEGAKLSFVQFSSAGAVTASNGIIRNVNNIEMNIATLTADNVALATTDRLAYMDDADADATKSVTLEALLNGVAGDGVSRDGGGLKLDVNDLATAAAIGHGDSFAFHDIDNTAGTKKSTVLQLAQLLAGGSDFDANASNSQLEIADDAVVLGHMEHGTQGDILVYGGSGVPTRLTKGTEHHVLRAGASDPAYGLLVDANIDGSAGIATSKLAADTISGKALGANLDDLTAGSGLEFTTAGDYNGGGAKTIRLAAGAIDQSALNSIEAYHIASGAIANNEILNGGSSGVFPVFGESSSVADFNNLVATVDNESELSLNRSVCLKV